MVNASLMLPRLFRLFTLLLWQSTVLALVRTQWRYDVLRIFSALTQKSTGTFSSFVVSCCRITTQVCAGRARKNLPTVVFSISLGI